MIDDIKTADIILKSKVNNNIYYLFHEKIYIQKETQFHEVKIPLINDIIICFHDMYYQKDELCIIVATRKIYDAVFVIDENTLELSFKNYCK